MHLSRSVPIEFIRHWKNISFCLMILSAMVSLTALAGPVEQATRIYNRIAGVPPSAQEAKAMADLIQAGKPNEAAQIAIDSSYFYNVTLKNWVAPWTNEDQSSQVPLNDFSATIIGSIRDDIPYDRLLWDDVLYTGADALSAGATPAIPAFSPASNDHFIAMDNQNIDLKQNLVKRVQSQITSLGDTAGVITSRASGEAFFNMGTNRAPLRFTLMNFLCRDLEQMSDTGTPDYLIRQDVDRSPGNDSKVFRNKCAGCHSGMDGLTSAFAHFDFVNGSLVHDANKVQAKMLQNAHVFSDGFDVSDDGWVNLWTSGVNNVVGWRGQGNGVGAKELGKALSQTDAFDSCAAEKVFERVCLRRASSTEDKQFLDEVRNEFIKDDKRNIKTLFKGAAVYCAQE
jgi:hypothetical protein